MLYKKIIGGILIECLQINVEELRQEMKRMKNERSPGFGG